MVEESRVLASRERCPYLVRVEVADTDLRGNDSRLYASGAPGLGATMEEALAMNSQTTSNSVITKQNMQEDEYGNYHIPSELFAPSSGSSLKRPRSITIEQKDLLTDIQPKQMPRGGWQSDDTAYYSHNPEDVYAASPYDAVRENELEQLHHQMYNGNEVVAHSPQSVTAQR